MFTWIHMQTISFSSLELSPTGITGRRTKPCQLDSEISVHLYLQMLKRNKWKDVQSDVLFKLYGNRHYYGFNPWEDSSWQRVHCPWAANGVKERLEHSNGRKGTEKVQIIRIYTSFPPLPILQLLKFPMLNHLEIPKLFSNLLYFARSLVQTNHKTDTSCKK